MRVSGQARSRLVDGAGVSDPYPQRIVCLTEEPTEILYRLGQQHRIVGISGFTVRPPEARREKPKVSAFTTARISQILALEPDLVIGFSDIQADIAGALIRAGIEVWISNHRSVRGILDYTMRLGAMVGAADGAALLVARMQAVIDHALDRARELPRRPRVYFEEWDAPLISGIRWVCELVRIAGGDDIFPERAACALGKDRIVAEPAEVVERAPQIMLASWCGKKFRPDHVRLRPGWSEVPAVRDGELHEIKSPIILQPGPAAILEGLPQIQAVIGRWSAARATSLSDQDPG